MALRVYNASAGAGKTFQLVENYLLLCLQNDSPNTFFRILAITFTNKAANEMKQRLIKALQEIAEYPQHASYSEQLAQKLQISPEKLAYRAQAVLRQILHNYSAFSISTIDSFTNRVIRSFSRDLNLSSHYQIELDTDLMLAEAIDRLLENTQQNDSVAKVLTRFIETQLDEGKSPHVEGALQKMGKSIYNENAQPFLQLLRGFSAEKFLESAGQMWTLQREFKNQVQEKAASLFEFLQQNQLEPGDFSGKYFYKQTRDRALGKMEPFTSSVTGAIYGERSFYAKSNKTAPAKIDPLADELRSRGQEFQRLFETGYEAYVIRQKVLKNIYSTAVLAKIEQNLEDLKSETSRLPIGDFNKLISQHLQQQPAPFIYEKIGDRYQHYFIDEFQDTSTLQWRNLLPLIEDALSQGGTSAMIVGDAKQAIYRWRGGDVQQFVELSQPGPVTRFPRKHIAMESNWRSRQEVVNFNNRFFEHCSALLDHPSFRSIFEAAAQKPQKEEGGLVSLEFLEEPRNEADKYRENQCQRTAEIILEALERGYALSDMAILVRKNEHGALLARHLVEREIAVVSPDSLKLHGSSEVEALVSFLKMLNRPDDKSLRLPWLHYIHEKIAPEESQHDFLKHHCHSSLESELHFCEENLTGWTFKDHQNESLTGKIYLLLSALGSPFRSDPYLQTFIDAVSHFEEEDSSAESAFLRWWDLEGFKRNVELPGGIEAVQIMSIHKSKGLQFPITIFAFANLNMQNQPDNEAWVKLPEGEAYGNLPAAKISFSREENLPEDSLYNNWHSQYQSAVQLDQLNMVYVAFTRAADELYVLSSNSFGSKSKNRLQDYLKAFAPPAEGESKVLFGQPTLPKKKASSEPVNRVETEKLVTALWREKLRISDQSPENWQKTAETEQQIGQKMHFLLAQIKTAHDVDAVLENAVLRGDFEKKEAASMRSKLEKLVHHPELKDYFAQSLEILNERSIFRPGAKQRIPDRVVLEGNTAHVLDYKTGAELPAHRQQVDEYMQLLTDMGFAPGQRVLIYLRDNTVVEMW